MQPSILSFPISCNRNIWFFALINQVFFLFLLLFLFIYLFIWHLWDLGFRGKINRGKLGLGGHGSVWSQRDSCPVTYISISFIRPRQRSSEICRPLHQTATRILPPSGSSLRRPRALPRGRLWVAACDVWPLLSRSRPSPRVLGSSRSDSRVKFIWYPA